MFRLFVFHSVFLGLAMGTAAAQCKLSVAATDPVLSRGESAQINVLAHFSSDGYAFAFSEFDVFADMPSWTFVNSGVIAGGNVLGAEGKQDNQPFAGQYADPSNPARIWTSLYTPDSYEPLLIEVQAVPNDFWFYPSELTSTAVECAAAPGSEWLLVNPLSVGRALVAPAKGTTIRRIGGNGRDLLIGGAGDDILIGGTTGYDEAILIGMLLPAVQKVRIVPEEPPLGLTTEAGVKEHDVPMGNVTIQFTGLESDPTYDLKADWAPADAYEYVVQLAPSATNSPNLNSFAGQTVRIRIAAADVSGASLILDRLPDAFATSVQNDTRTNQSRVISRFEFDKPARIVAPDGSVLAADSVEVHACQNNLKQLAIAVHTVEVAGTGVVQFSFGDGSVRSVSRSISK